MKTKFRLFTAVLSAMLCMICCVLSAVPAFADDIGINAYIWNDTIKQNVFSCIPESDKTDYYTVIAAPFGDKSVTYSLIFCKSSTSVTYLGSNLHHYVSKSDYNAFACVLVNSENNPIYDDNATRWWSENGDYYDHDPYDYSGGQAKVIYSNVPVLKWEDKKTPVWEDPNAPIVPFSVQYSPTLCKEMSNKVYYPSKGGANADSSGLVEDENYNLSVKVKLTDDFLKKTAVQNGYLEYSYQYTLFIVPSQFKDSDIKTMSDKAIYTAVNKSQFLYTGNERLDIDHSQTSEPATDVDTSKDVDNQWANANGITNCFYIPRDGSKSSTSTVNIDLHTVNWAKYDYDSYNIVVLSHVIRKTEYGWTAYPYYFTSDCENLSKESKKEYPIKANADDPTKYDNVELYDYYTVVSDDFSLKDIPEYVQQTCDGTTIDQNSPLDFKNKADTVQDYELWKNGEKKNQEDFDDYKKQKQQAENFSDVNFGIDDISSIFDGTSSFYKFLTASISILPPYFLLILGAFFVTMLAICVVKWVLK